MEKMMKRLATVSAVSLALVSVPTFSYDSGDLVLRLGAATVSPNDDSSALTLNGVNLEDLGLGLPRSEAEVGDDTQLGITATYMLNSHFGIELLAATPFRHDIKAKGLNLDAGSTKHLPPTLSLQYYPMDSGSAFQPYIGLGVNYTVFFDEDVDSELNGALMDPTLGATGEADLKLENSLGLAAQVGMDYAIDKHWVVNAAVWYIDIDTDAEFDVPGLGKIEADVGIDPLTYILAVGYRF